MQQNQVMIAGLPEPIIPSLCEKARIEIPGIELVIGSDNSIWVTAPAHVLRETIIDRFMKLVAELIKEMYSN